MSRTAIQGYAPRAPGLRPRGGGGPMAAAGEGAVMAGHLLDESAKVVRDAVSGRVQAGRDMEVHFDHPILLLQLMIWHEGYHHGQIKLALKSAGHPIADQEAGPLTWGVWMRKR